MTPRPVTLAGTRSYDGSTNFTSGAFGTFNTGANGETLTIANGTGTVPSAKVSAGTQPLATGALALGNGTGVASDYQIAASGNTGTITPSATFGFAWDTGSAIDLRWENAANWNQGVAPLNGTVATIPGGLGGPVVYSSLSGVTNLASLASGSGLTLTGGTLNLLETSSFSGRPLTLAGGTLGGGGTVSLSGTTLDILTGGVLTGSRTIIGDVNNLAGIVMPGASPGTLTINGNYVQGSAGTLAAELGGSTAGTQYDQLIVTGTASLGGALDVTLVNGFLPVDGETFTVVQAGTISGTFATSSLPAGTTLTTAYTTSSVNLASGASSEPPLNPIIETINTAVPNPPPPAPVTNPDADFIDTLPPTGAGVPGGTYVNLDTGQIVQISDPSLLEPGIYFNRELDLVLVVGTVDVDQLSFLGANMANIEYVQFARRSRSDREVPNCN